MRYARVSALGILTTALCCGSAMAQQMYQPYILNEGRVASPANVDTQQVNFSISETYDSNVAQSDAAVAATRGLVLSDAITTLGMNTTIIQTLGRQRFVVKADFNYDWYARNHILDLASADFSGGDTLSFGQCGITVHGDYYRGNSDVPLLPTVAVRDIRSTGNVAADLNCSRPYGIVPNLSVSQRWNTNSANLYRDANSKAFSVTGGLDFRTPTLGSLGVWGEYDNIKYNSLFIPFGGGLFRDEFDVFTGGVKYSKQLTPQLGAQAVVTYTNVNSPIDGGPHFNGLTYALEAYYNVAPKFSANAYVTREVLPSDLPFATFAVVEDYHLVTNYAVSSAFRLQLEGWVDHYSYRGTTSLEALNPLISLHEQTDYKIQGTARLWINDHAHVEAFVGEQHRSAGYAPLSYWATLVGLRLRASFGH